MNVLCSALCVSVDDNTAVLPDLCVTHVSCRHLACAVVPFTKCRSAGLLCLCSNAVCQVQRYLNSKELVYCSCVPDASVHLCVSVCLCLFVSKYLCACVCGGVYC